MSIPFLRFQWSCVHDIQPREDVLDEDSCWNEKNKPSMNNKQHPNSYRNGTYVKFPQEFEHSIRNLSTSIPLARAMRKATPSLPSSVLAPQSRLTHFIEEPVMGRDFIKEACFSPDGRVIGSPCGLGIRLLAFNEKVSELCDCVPSSYVGLNQVASIMCHSTAVLCTKFSPTQNMLASGSFDGNIFFHQPIL